MLYEIRPGLAEDAAVIADFNCRLAHETEQLALDPAAVLIGVKAMLADSTRGRYLVAAAGPEVVGQLALTLEWSDWWNGWYWWIQSVYVRADARGQGVFGGLFAEVVRQARAAGNVAAIRLYVEQHNAAARHVYTRLGMAHSGYEVLELKTR